MIANEYYSNCLVEALKAKLKWGNHVDLIFIPSWKNDGVPWVPHWMWYDRDDGNVYDFHTNKWMEHWWNCLWWKGYIRIQPLKVFNRWYKTTGKEYAP